MRLSPGLAAATLALAALWCHAAASASEGRAVVRVEFEPAAGGVLGFEGAHAGPVRVPANGRASVDATLEAGTHVTRLVAVDPQLSGWELTSIQCDDASSASASQSDVAARQASFAIDPGETVTCTFRFEPGLACTCPREGRWQVVNHPGTMTCTGAMSMSMPLAPSRQVGTLTPDAACRTLRAEGLTDDDADIDMRLQPDCSWAGSVGGSQGPIPMQIDFRWTVSDGGRRIVGRLSSDMVQQGMTCRARREFSLDFDG